MIDFLYKYKCIPVLDINNDVYIHSYSKPVIYLKYLLGVYLIPLNELENDIENLNKMDIDIIKLIQEFLEKDSCVELKVGYLTIVIKRF